MLWGRNCGRTWAMQVSDGLFYLRHPVLFYREIWLDWRASKVGQGVWEL